MLNRERITETFEDFLEEHSEISIIKDWRGRISKIKFPSDAEQTSCTIIAGEVVQLYYKYHGDTIMFPWYKISIPL